MFFNKFNRKTYSNIKTKLKNQVNIDASMILKREIVDYKKNRKTEENEPVYKTTLNSDFWKETAKKENGINVTLDEAHSIINSRRAMSKTNIIVNDWLSLIRRVLGQTEQGFGELTFITQLWNRIDIVAREMASNIIYCICYYRKRCSKCGSVWLENSELPEPLWECFSCNSLKIKKYSHFIEVWHFQSMQHFIAWKDMRMKTFYKHYYVRDIENYFHLYDTLQWDNLFSEFY